MSMKVSRRQLLKGTAAAGAGLALGAYPLKYARAAGGKITIGTEAGSPYDTFYKKHAAEFTKATGVEVEFNAIPHDIDPPAVRPGRAVRLGRLRRLHRRPGVAARVLREGLHQRPLRAAQRRRQGRLLQDGDRDRVLQGRDRGAADHGPQLRHVLPHRSPQGGRALGAAVELGRVPRIRQEAHQGPASGEP